MSIELNKFVTHLINNEQERWLQFFKYAEQFDDTALPEWMSTTEMKQAMTTLRQFSEKEISYFRYQARQDYLRQQRTIKGELEEERQGRLQALRERDFAIQRENQAIQRENQAIQSENQAIQRENQALAEIERLKALLSGPPV